jgi:hypothetical protein
LIEALDRGITFLERLFKVSERARKDAAKQLRDLESCLIRYYKGVKDNNEAAMRRISAEMTEIMSSFQQRVLQVIDVERDRQLIEEFSNTWDVEKMALSDDTPDDQRNDRLERLDCLIGRLSGLVKTLAKP